MDDKDVWAAETAKKFHERQQQVIEKKKTQDALDEFVKAEGPKLWIELKREIQEHMKVLNEAIGMGTPLQYKEEGDVFCQSVTVSVMRFPSKKVWYYFVPERGELWLERAKEQKVHCVVRNYNGEAHWEDLNSRSHLFSRELIMSPLEELAEFIS